MDHFNKKEKIKKPLPAIIHFMCLCLSLICSNSAMAQGNNLIDISGKVSDKDNRQPLSGVSLSIN